MSASLLSIYLCIAIIVRRVSCQCADSDSYCFSGLALGHTWDQYSTQYQYEGVLNGCAFFKSIDDLYIYWASTFNVWAVTHNVEDGSALAACTEPQLDDCISSKWLLNGAGGYAVDFNLQVQSCAYDNSECLAAFSVHDAHCIANTDHRTSNSGLASKYHFEGCSMAQPHFQYTMSPTSIISLTWNAVLSVWFLKTYPDNAPWQTLGYCLQPELNDCSSNWHIHDSSDFIVDPLVISGLCPGCALDYDLCVEAVSIGYEAASIGYEGRYGFTQCDANGYPVFEQYESVDGDASNSATLQFNYTEATFFVTEVSEPSVRYASCHAVSWQVCAAYDLWMSDELAFVVDQCVDATSTTTSSAPDTTDADTTRTDETLSTTTDTVTSSLTTTSFSSSLSSSIVTAVQLQSLSTLTSQASDAAQSDPITDPDQGSNSLITIVIIVGSVLGACIIVLLAVSSTVLCLKSAGRKRAYTHDLAQMHDNVHAYALPPLPNLPPPPPPPQPNMQAANVVALEPYGSGHYAANDDISYAFQPGVPGHRDTSSPAAGTPGTHGQATPKHYLRHFSASNTDNDELYEQGPALEMQALNQQQQHLAAAAAANIDPRQYEQWNSQQVESWLTGLERGRYVRYVHHLMSGFTNDAVPASDLPDLDQGILRVFGVDNHHDRQGLLRQLRRLRGSTIGEGADEAAQNKEGHGVTTTTAGDSDDADEGAD